MDKEINNLVKRIKKDGVIVVHNGELVRRLSKKPSIRKLRSNDMLFIAKDRRKNVSIIYNKSIFKF